jgi:hypothetical protein
MVQYSFMNEVCVVFLIAYYSIYIFIVICDDMHLIELSNHRCDAADVEAGKR